MNKIFSSPGASGKLVFNMTAVIDVVFLLIVFLVVVCHFIETDDLAVQVPDRCDLSEDANDAQPAMLTIALVKNPAGQVEFVLGKDKFSTAQVSDLPAMLAEKIDSRLCDEPTRRQVVTLRFDKSITFRDFKYVLAGVSAAKAGHIRLATLKNAQAE